MLLHIHRQALELPRPLASPRPHQRISPFCATGRHESPKVGTDAGNRRGRFGTRILCRRMFLLNSSSAVVLASILNFGGARPSGLGLRDYGEDNRQLGLCPQSPPCMSTAEAANDDNHYVPPWTYNPTAGRGKRSPATKAQAMAELKEVVSTLKPDKFEPTIVKETPEYLYVEYKSPFFGFVDDVEFYFTDKNSEVEYRSASRIGDSDFDINRKRIRAIRKELEKKGWRSVGF